MNDGRTITDHEEKLAARLALAWNSNPDLLEAAKATRDFFKARGWEMSGVFVALEAAIAKAEVRP